MTLDTTNEPDEIVLPYKPRTYFRPVHLSQKRLKFVVAHRRAGKTVALANTLIKAALENPRHDPPPRYALCRTQLRPDQGSGLELSQALFSDHPRRPLPRRRTVDCLSLGRDDPALRRRPGLRADARHLSRRRRARRISAPQPEGLDLGRAGLPRRLPGLRDHHRHLEWRRSLPQTQTDRRGRRGWDIFDIKITDTGEEALSLRKSTRCARTCLRTSSRAR